MDGQKFICYCFHSHVDICKFEISVYAYILEISSRFGQVEETKVLGGCAKSTIDIALLVPGRSGGCEK